MPCRDDYPDERFEEHRRVERERDDLVTLLCMAMGVIEGNDLMDQVHKRCRHWWRKHKEEDRQRIAAHARELKQKEVRKKALAKLTAQERLLLGVKY